MIRQCGWRSKVYRSSNPLSHRQAWSLRPLFCLSARVCWNSYAHPSAVDISSHPMLTTDLEFQRLLQILSMVSQSSPYRIDRVPCQACSSQIGMVVVERQALLSHWTCREFTSTVKASSSLLTSEVSARSDEVRVWVSPHWWTCTSERCALIPQ